MIHKEQFVSFVSRTAKTKKKKIKKSLCSETLVKNGISHSRNDFFSSSNSPLVKLDSIFSPENLPPPPPKKTHVNFKHKTSHIKLRLMKNFVKPIDTSGEDFLYLELFFFLNKVKQNLCKKKKNIFVVTQIKKFMKYEILKEKLSVLKKKKKLAWVS